MHCALPCEAAGPTGPGATRKGLLGKAESGVMDEPATEKALVAYLGRGVDCGALDPDEVEV